MIPLYTWAAISVAFTLFVYFSIIRDRGQLPRSSNADFAAAVTLAVAVRIILSLNTSGYEVDVNCFGAWSGMMAEHGPAGFYVDDVFCDYPPGYLYTLGIVGVVRNMFSGLPQSINLFLIKLPAMVCDILTGFFIYFAAQKVLKNKSFAAAAAALYMLHPAVIINSAVWGQVDAVFALPLVISIYFLAEEQYKKSSALYAVALLIKPQALVFAPIFLLAFADKLVNFKSQKNWWTEFFKCLGIIFGVFILGALPFLVRKPPMFIYELYTETLASYPYASLNGFNLFALAGGNFKDMSDRFFFATYSFWSNVGIIITVAVASVIFMRGKDKSRYFYCSGLLGTVFFMLAGKMHERYLFPAMALFILAYVFRRDKRILITWSVLSMLHYLNVGYVYINSQNGVYHIQPDDLFLVVVSLLGLITTLYAVYLGFSMYGGIKIKKAEIFPTPNKRITRKDTLIMAVVTVAYAVLAFSNLGDINAPQTSFDFNERTGAVADLGEVRTVSEMLYYKGLGTGEIELISSMDGSDWERVTVFDAGPCFRWGRQEFSTEARFFGIRPASSDTEIFEVAFFEQGSKAPLKMAYADKELFDEQNLVPDSISYLNGTYFDEIYHARTAYEHVEGIWPYEITHPPLGKIIIAAGIKMFGMNPFGWRFSGTLFGVLMLPLMYMFGKRMFKNTFAATSVMLFMALDFMHFTQTRIATIDTYGVFFIILMYYFMYIYFDSDRDELPYKKSLLVLLLCGASFGLGIASKWIGAYAGAGLAVLFVAALYKRRTPKAEIIKTCLWCVLFFVGVPSVIYFASYIPYFLAEPSKNAFTIFLDNQKYMFTYHADLAEGHPFSSDFYLWPVMYRPIWYYGGTEGLTAGKISSIVALGNPAVWWGGSAAALFVMGKWLTKKKKEAAFITVGLMSQYLPWALIGRTVFIYHFFASIPFVILAMGYVVKLMTEKLFYAKRYVVAYLVLTLLLFIMFYPIMSGMPVDKTYVLDNLKWFDSWVLSY